MLVREEIKAQNPNFILDVNTPEFLRRLIVSYLSISDITKIINHRTSDINLIELQHKCNLLRAVDFEHLLPLIAIKIEDIHLVEKLNRYIRGYSLGSKSNPELFARTIAHFQYLEPAKSNELLLETLSDKSMDVHIVKLVIENMPLIEIKAEKKQVGTYTYHSYKPIKKEDAFKPDDWGDMILRSDVDTFDEDYNPGWFQIICHVSPVYIDHSTLLLNALLRFDGELTNAIIVHYFEYVDEILSGLIEYYLLSNLEMYELDHKQEELKTAWMTTASVLAELDYRPRTISAKSRKILSCSIAEQRLTKVVSLSQLIVFAERHETEIFNLQQFLQKLKEYILNEISEAQPQLVLIDKAIKYLAKMNINFSQLLLDNAVLNSNLVIAEILVNHHVKLCLYDENRWGDKTIRNDITVIYLGLKKLAKEAKTANQMTTIEHLQMQARPVVLEYKEKEKLIAEIVEKIAARYRSNHDFNVYYWGGENCSSLGNKVIPDGIARIMDEHHSSDNVLQKFNKIEKILKNKHNSIFQCCFWKPKRDPILEKFYCDFNEKITKLAARKFI